VKSLDDIAKRKSTNRDLFSTETIFYRNRFSFHVFAANTNSGY